MRNHRGNRPDDGQLVASTTIDGQQWELYIRPTYTDAAIDDGWQNYKLIGVPRAAFKANYWFGWNTKTQRFARCTGISELVMSRPAVLEWLKLEMRDPAAARLLYGS